MKKLILLSGVLALLNGCTTLDLNMPNPRVEVPELRGQKGWRIEVTGGGGHTYKSTDDANARPPKMNEPSVRDADEIDTINLEGSAALAVTPRFEFGLGATESGDMLSPGIFGTVKYQLLGDGVTQASTGNIPLTVFARLGSAFYSSYGDQKETFGPGGYKWRGDIKGYYGDVGLSTGYRFSTHSMIYTGVAIGSYRVETRLSQDRSSDGTDPGGSYDRHDNGKGSTAALGLLFNWRVVQCYVGGEYSDIRYDDTNSAHGTFVRAGVTITP